MGKRNLRGIGKRALVALLALCMSLMMVPATAFADIGGNAYQVEVDASEADVSHTTGEDVSSTYTPAVGVLADNGHTAEVALGNVTSTSMKQTVMVESDNGGTANVAMGDVSDTYRWAGNGIDVKTKGGDIDITAGNVSACKVGLNIDNAPTGTLTDFTGEKRVTVESVTQTNDSRYSDAGVNAFSYTSGDTNIVQVKGDVVAAGSRGLDILAKGGSETTVTVGGTVNANYLGVKAEAGCLGNVHGTTVSTGTATVTVGGVVSKQWDKAVEIDSNTKGSTVTFQSNGNVQALGSNSSGIFTRADGGKSNIVVNGDVSGTFAGLRIYCNEIGSNDVLVSGTISGKNGVDISYDSIENDSLTVWKIEKASNGQYVSSEWNNVPSDDREIFAKKRINYIVRVAEAVDSSAANLRAAKDAQGTELDLSHGYDVAKEGAKVYLVVDPGYRIVSASNGNDNQVVQQDAAGNYYIIVKRGGGIDLLATVEAISAIDSIVLDYSDAAPAAEEGSEPSAAPAANAAVQRGPLLTVGGVQIDKVKLEMKDQAPNLHLTLSNTNDRDVEFDCTKFKVTTVNDEKEIPFKTKAEKLKANESSAEFDFAAEANALSVGDRANVYYDNQLLGTFTVAEP